MVGVSDVSSGSRDLVDVQQGAASSDPSSSGPSVASPRPASPQPIADPPSPPQATEVKGLNPVYVVVGAAAAILAAVAAIWLSKVVLSEHPWTAGAAASTAADDALHTTFTKLQNRSAGAVAALAPVLSSVLRHTWIYVIQPLADVPRQMIIGWQHVWHVMWSHPNVLILHDSAPQWLANLITIIPGSLLVAAVVAVGGIFLLQWSVNKERGNIRCDDDSTPYVKQYPAN